MNKEVVNIFWTGGWDSTYMLLKLLENKKTVQPIYVVDSSRDGKEKEIIAMNKIIDALKDRDYLGGMVLTIKKINLSDIPNNDEISEAYKKICSEIKLGSQYEWLARLAIQYSPICIGIEKPNGEFSGCVEAISKFGKLDFIDNVGYLEKDQSSKECNLLFQNFRFPIINVTENEMLEDVKLKDYNEIMKNIWFCHSPINNRPCGLCRPCEQKMDCNMEFLLPEKAQKRYFKAKKCERFFGKKGRNIFIKIIRKTSK